MGLDEQQEPMEEGTEPKPSKDDILKSKYLERNFEKIIKILREPTKPPPTDYVIIGLLGIIIVLLLVKSFGGGGNIAFSERQDETLKKIDALTKKVDHLEKQLLAVAGIDEDYKIIQDENLDELAKKNNDDVEENKDEKPPQGSTEIALTKPLNAVKMGPAKENDQGPDKTYKVKNGDTLWVICWKVYRSKDPAVIETLGRYNSLEGPNFDLFPGNTIKLPSKEELAKLESDQAQRKKDEQQKKKGSGQKKKVKK